MNPNLGLRKNWQQKTSHQLSLRTHNTSSSTHAKPHHTDHAIRSLRYVMPFTSSVLDRQQLYRRHRLALWLQFGQTSDGNSLNPV
jgi:hypothetical protein